MAIADTDVRSPLDVTRRLGPSIRASADQIEAARELPTPLFEALADGGLFHLVVPRSLGGAELDLPTYIRVMEELGKADASTAWVINQGAVFATQAAFLPPRVARTIWIGTPRSMVANNPAPDGLAQAVDGGYRVSGRLSFSTGCRQASWLAVLARVFEAGQPRRLADGQPETRHLFVPAAEVEILDTWDARGMRGTGTHHFTLTDVFVPAERTLPAVGAPAREPGPLYVFPRTLLFASGDGGIALGVARSSLESFIDLAGGKMQRGADRLLRDQSLIQADVGHAEADLRSGRALLRETVGEVWEAVCASGAISLEQRVALRLATTHAIRLAVGVVDRVYNAAGTTAIYPSSPIQRRFQDIHVISQHLQARLNHYESVGRFYLGLEPDMQRL